jgi:hypothetical protein
MPNSEPNTHALAALRCSSVHCVSSNTGNAGGSLAVDVTPVLEQFDECSIL